MLLLIATMKDLFDRLKEIRIRCKLSQEDIASRIGVNRRTIEKWEKGKSKPLKVMRRELNKHLNFLLERLETNEKYDRLDNTRLPLADV